MLSYLQSQLFPTQKQASTCINLESLQELIASLQNDTQNIESQILQCESKIQKLPLQIKRKIKQHQVNNSNQKINVRNIHSNAFQNAHSDSTYKVQQKNNQYQHDRQSPNVFSSAIDKKLLEQRLKSLQQQQEEITYISRLSDIYLRSNSQVSIDYRQLIQYDYRQLIQQEKTQQKKQEDKHHRQKSFEKQQLQKISQFIVNIQPFSNDESLVNRLVSNIKCHTSKKLVEKCQGLIHFGSRGPQKVIIEHYLIKNCRTLILGDQPNQDEQATQKSHKIVSKFIEKILADIIYYDVCYQKIILMEVIQVENKQSKNHQDIITRRKVYFLPTQTQKHFYSIKSSLQFHLNKVSDVRHLLCNQKSNSNSQFQSYFDKVVEKYIIQMKANLEYILPYLNIKSRKEIMKILTHGKEQVIQFEDLVLRLKFKGQDGDMFMNNLDAVFGRVVQVNISSQDVQFKFNELNFQTLLSFFELGIYEAQQSLFQTSSKAFNKLTTNFSMRGSSKRPNQIQSSIRSKKLFNMIFFSVSTLIDKLDELTDKYSAYLNKQSNFEAEQKLSLWSTRVIEVRQSVRKKIHME